MAKWFEFFYNQVFIGIHATQKGYTVAHVVEKQRKIKDQGVKIFDAGENGLTPEAVAYINTLESKSPFSYLSYMSDAKIQGAVEGCSLEAIDEDSQFNDVKSLCMYNKWSVYMENKALTQTKETYKKVGVDFIFSPFLLLLEEFSDKTKKNGRLFVLLDEAKLTLCTFNDGVLSFGFYQQNIVESEEQDDNLVLKDDGLSDFDTHDDLGLDLDLGIDDDVLDLDNLDDMDSLDGLDDISELDTLDNLDDVEELDDHQDTIDDELQNLDELETIDEFADEDIDHKTKEESFEYLADSGLDFQRFSIISKAMERYYRDEKYHSEFVEEIYIASENSVSKDLKKYLEEELLVTVYSRETSIAMLIAKLALKEVHANV